MLILSFAFVHVGFSKVTIFKWLVEKEHRIQIWSFVSEKNKVNQK